MQLSEALPVVTVVHCGIGTALVESSDVQCSMKAHGMDLNCKGGFNNPLLCVKQKYHELSLYFMCSYSAARKWFILAFCLNYNTAHELFESNGRCHV